MPPKRDRSPNGRNAAPSNVKIFDTLSADQKKGVGRLVASLTLQYHSRKEILESVDVLKAVKDFLGLSGDVRLRLDEVRVSFCTTRRNITQLRFFLLPMMYCIQKFECALLKCVAKAWATYRLC
jgi:hypothetical protein